MDNMQKFLDAVNEQHRELCFDNLKDFLDSVNADRYTYICLNNSKKTVKKTGREYEKSIRSRYKNFSTAFVASKFNYESKINNRQRLLWALIMDYYFPDYLDGFLLPYIKHNSNGDISRARINLEKTKAITTYIDGEQAQKVLKSAQDRYDRVTEIYNTDWEGYFKGIKQVNQLIKAIEEISNNASVSGL